MLPRSFSVAIAALSASSISDFISGYGALLSDGLSMQFIYETGQTRIGATPWENRKSYIENSPVLRADKVCTPLLMMNNKIDPVVPFSQGVEFFTALRRLGKPVWMLQYDGEEHTALGEKASMDYTLRMTQFFDHYLKGAPAPKWMTIGIPAKLKGVSDGMQLDLSGQKP